MRFSINHRRSHVRRPVEAVEGRLLFAAHVVGSPGSYATIQAAVNAAPAGGTVAVDAGTYAEQVTITKSLTVQGARTGADARAGGRPTATASTESVVTGAVAGSVQTSAFHILADDVTVDGFTVTGQTSQDDALGAGVVIGPGRSGTHVIDDVVRGNVSGLFLANASPTDAALVQHCYFGGNNNAGANGGRGIYTDGAISGGHVTNVTIDANTFVDNHGTDGTTGLEAAVAFEAAAAGGQSDVRITNNTMTDNGKAVLFFNTTGVLIQGNTVTDTQDQYSGSLRFEGNDHDVSIVYNAVHDNTGPALAVDSKGVPGDNSGFVVEDDNFYGNNNAYAVPISVVFDAGTFDGALDARNDYWGSASGPSGYGPGTGDAVGGGVRNPDTGWALAAGGNVVYAPWATATVATQPPVPAGPTDYLRLAADGTTLDVWYATAPTGTPDYAQPLAALATLTLAPTVAAPATVTVDFSNGDPVPAGGLTVDGTRRATSLALVVVGTPGNDSVTVDAATAQFGSDPAITYTGLTAVTVNGDGGADTLTQAQQPAGHATLALAGDTAADTLVVNGGTFTVPAPAAGAGVSVYPLAGLSIGPGGRFAVATADAATDRTLLRVSSLSDAGTLDLGGNDLDLPGATVSTVAALARAGYADGTWSGPGLDSSAAAADPGHLTAVGVVQNVAATGGALYTSFDGQAVTTTDVLARYTDYGDANLDGRVDAADYALTDAGLLLHRGGWGNGDFNGDGAVDGSDYTLVDNAFNQQSGAIASPKVAVAVVQAARVTTAAAARLFTPPAPVPPAASAGPFPVWPTTKRLREEIDGLR